MAPFWPSKAEFLGPPRRVSRLFIILFIFSATANALLGIVYGYLQLTYDRTTQQQAASVTAVLQQAQQYKDERDTATATVAERNLELKTLNDELAQKNKELAATEKQLASLNDKVKTQETQLAANSTELSSLRSRPPLFSFQKNTTRDVAADEAAVRAIVTAAYDSIKSIYGEPYILHQITISFVDTLSISGASGEITITNGSAGLEMTIRLTAFDKNSYENVNTIVHEIIHGFHGLSAHTEPIIEEGIAVAATDVVMRQLYRQGTITFDRDYVTITDEQAGQLNSTLTPPPSTSALYNDSNVATYYQLAGWAWTQLYEADSQFFARFNDALYDATIKGTTPSQQLTRSLIKQLISSVNGQPVDDWLNSQITFNPL